MSDPWAAFADEIEAREPETFASVLSWLEADGGFHPAGRLDARTVAALVVAMELDGHVDADLFKPSQQHRHRRLIPW